MIASPPLFESNLRSLPLVHRGKVRDIYAIDAEHWLIVASDRLSAFDVVLPTPIPGKGVLLTQLSNFWFNRFKTLIPNHLQLATVTLEQALPDADERAAIRDRAIVVRRLRALPIEAVVRGYLIGSGFKDYRRSGAVCGIPLPANLRQADRLPTPIFTPATKAAVGQHDENIDFDQAAALIGNTALAEQVRAISLTLYKTAAAHAQERGIIIADTKFEFGLDETDRLVLIDEALTPDSSRFWPAESYQPGMSPPSFDKQFVRDYLETLAWDKTAPGPTLPDAIVAKTAAIYQQALERLTRLN